MRLRVKHSETKEVIEKQQKKETKEKSSKKIKINKDYKNTKPFKVDKADIDLTKLKYGAIESHELTGIITPDGYLEINDSWIGLIILLLNYLITEYAENFRDILISNDIASQTFCIDKIYGKYNFEKDRQFKVYNIYETGYYLEAIFDTHNIFEAITKLVYALNMDFKEIKLCIQRKGYKEVKLNYGELETHEEIVTIDNLSDKLTSCYKLTSISILTSNTSVQRLDIALVIFCTWVLNEYGRDELLKLPKNKETGITAVDTGIHENITSLKNGLVYVYTDNNIESIINFLKTSMQKLNISKEQIKFKLRALRKKEET